MILNNAKKGTKHDRHDRLGHDQALPELRPTTRTIKRGKVRLPGQIRANDLQRFEDAGTVRGPLADGQTFSEG
jgi:hypothetical protein